MCHGCFELGERMKYGLIIDFGQSFCNYGDLVQSVAIEYIYQQMGIPSEEIVRLTKNDLANYNGELLLLPFSYTIFYMIDFATRQPLLSDKIIPVFLGVSIESIFIYNSIPTENFASPDSKWLDMFRKNAPVGCRDHFTKHFLLKHGVSAYLQGCITNIFPRRQEGDYNMILLVDCPAAILPHIPKVLPENAEIEILSNVVPAEGSAETNYQRVKERYDYYRDNAAFVVTTRYHVALPCSAMGIPSVAIKPPRSKYIEDVRWDAIPLQVQVCSSQLGYENINWNANHDDFYDIKKEITDLAMLRIKEGFVRHSIEKNIQNLFTQNLNVYNANKSSHVSYRDVLQDYVRNHHLNNEGKFYIWGAMGILCNGNSVEIADIVISINPALMFAGWIDTFKSGALAEKPIYKICEIDLGKNDFIIVSAESAACYSLSCFVERKLGTQNYVLLCKEMLSEDDI